MEVWGWIIIGLLSVTQITLVIIAIKQWKRLKGFGNRIDRNEFLK